MTAETIAKALGGRKAGRGWMARCPAHDDCKPSLSIRNGVSKVLVRCYAGCDPARVIAVLRSRGLWEDSGRHRFVRRQPDQSIGRELDSEAGSRADAALGIWNAAGPAHGTGVKNYLASRGLHLPPPPTLRFHRGLKHLSGDFWPAMVGLVTHGVSDAPLAIHRTFLAPDGSAKAPVEPQRMMFGPCRGGAIRLAAPSDVLMVGEGIETCLAAMQSTGQPAWAALSTSGLRTLDLPADVREVIILADGDDPGEAAARDCAWRWKREGRRVRIARPPQGMDFNDMLVARTSRIEDCEQ